VDRIAPDRLKSVERAAGEKGGGDVWREVYERRYEATVYLAGLLVGDFRLGEEVAQDAFVRLFESWTRVREPDRFLRGTVVNLCRARVRHTMVVRRREPAAGVVDAEPDVADRLVERSAVAVALRRLSRRQREAVVLRHYWQLSEAETAEAMGVSAGAVKTHLSRAVAALAADLEELR